MKVYEYDKFNRLIKYNDGGTEATYTYNANNLRQSKTVNGSKTSFVWNGQNLAGETKNGTTTSYTYDSTGIILSDNGTDTTRYIKDPHGNVAATSRNNTIIGEYDYTAFGNQTECTDTSNPFRYCGEYYDDENGLVYLRNRYYNSTTGRFITEDPIKDGLNWYSYCGGNPVMLVDPSGTYREPGYNKYGVWSNNPDADDYGVDSVVYKALGYLGDAWSHFESFRPEIEELASEVRYLANELTASAIDIEIKWSTKVGLMPENLNYVEQVLSAGYPLAAMEMNSARNKADDATWEIFGEAGNGDGEANAFKHAYWNAEAAKSLGEKMTRLFANAHEFGWVWENISNPIPMEMDLHNNMVGREVGTSSLEQRDVKSAVLRRLINGSLWKIVNGDLIKTNANAQFSS